MWEEQLSPGVRARAHRISGTLSAEFGEEPTIWWNGAAYPVLAGQTDLPGAVHDVVRPWINQYYAEVAAAGGSGRATRPWRRLPGSPITALVVLPGALIRADGPLLGIGNIDPGFRLQFRRRSSMGTDVVYAHPAASRGFFCSESELAADPVHVEWWASNLWFHLDMRFGAETTYELLGDEETAETLRDLCVREMDVRIIPERRRLELPGPRTHGLGSCLQPSHEFGGGLQSSGTRRGRTP